MVLGALNHSVMELYSIPLRLLVLQYGVLLQGLSKK